MFFLLLLLDGYPTVDWNASIVSTFRDVAAAAVVFSSLQTTSSRSASSIVKLPTSRWEPVVNSWSITYLFDIIPPYIVISPAFSLCVCWRARSLLSSSSALIRRPFFICHFRIPTGRFSLSLARANQTAISFFYEKRGVAQQQSGTLIFLRRDLSARRFQRSYKTTRRWQRTGKFLAGAGFDAIGRILLCVYTH